MPRIAIIGAGRGGLALMRVLKDNEQIEIVGVCDTDSGAPGLVEAARLGIATYSSCDEFLGAAIELDLIINVTADAELSERLEELKDPKTELIHGSTAELVWELIAAQQRIMNEVQERMVEMKDLYQLGIKLSSSTDLKEVYSYIIRYATRLTGTPAGSIALLDESAGEMYLAHSEGFSEHFNKFSRWKLRPGGLTNHILNQEEPVIIPDVSQLDQGVNPALKREGVQSIIATPLMARGKIIGILYVDDFIKRQFSDGEASILGLLSGYAALAIEKTKLFDDTRKMAITDGLTGLRNQQEFLARLAAETTRAERYGRKLSVVGIDIDNFKQYNDKHGHLAGNDLLRVLARVISENSRKADLSARIGGEEFAIIMPETALPEAVMLAERLRRTVESMHERFHESMEGLITVSIGVAIYPEHGETPKDLYKSADDALYKAKAEGRNCVVIYPDTSATEFLEDPVVS